ncbi:MAG: cytidine deaminase [Halobacteriaceae archaeon]
MEELVKAAREAREFAYIPYSEYAVGAAIESQDGSIYTGCNIEIANYSNTLHAEEVAIASALMDGVTNFSRLAVSSAEQDGITPCGMCRQTLHEFCSPELPIYCDCGDGVNKHLLQELLPEAMSQENL